MHRRPPPRIAKKISARRPRLIVMAKAPILGRVKSRLARDIGGVAALRCARAMLRHTLQRLGRDPRWKTVIAVTPGGGSRFAVAPGLRVIGQGCGDLGRRMKRLLGSAGRAPTILIGSDVPGVSRRHVAIAFRRLAACDAVFGQAEDGGYWLVGARHATRLQRMFDGVRWSGPHALADTIRNLEGRRIAFAAKLADLDDGADYARLRGWAERLIPTRPQHPPSQLPAARDAPPASA